MAKQSSNPKSKKKPSAQFMSRTQAVRKLQLSLKDFRRLCILKGVYPRDAKKKVKSANRTYYYTKDILYLAHEPVLQKFREFKTFLKRVTKASGRGDKNVRKRLKSKRPSYRLDHLVKERYQSFEDALADMDDSLCLVAMFASLPQTAMIAAHRTRNCCRLFNEFQAWVMHSKCLTKVFVSIKGTYYQASIQGKNVTWLVPHKFHLKLPKEVDFRVMLTFLEFYEVMLHFVNFRLYKMSQLKYPPQLDDSRVHEGLQLSSVNVAQVTQKQKGPAKPKAAANGGEYDEEEMLRRAKQVQQQIDSIASRDQQHAAKDKAVTEEAPAEDQDEMEDDQVFGAMRDETTQQSSSVFKGCVFFISREVPHESLVFVIQSGGGSVSWEGESAPFPRSSDDITHELVDRPSQNHQYLSREYVQPQWVYDSFNAKVLLSCGEYAPGVPPPPHLSPFVDDAAEGYIPERAKQVSRFAAAARGEEVEENAESSSEEEEEGENDNEDETGQDQTMQDEDDADDAKEGIEPDSSDDEDDVAEEDYVPTYDEPQAVEHVEKQREVQDDDEGLEEDEYQRELAAEKKGLSYSAAQNETKKPSKPSKKRKAQIEEEEHRAMSINMMSKKHKRLYDRAMHGKQQKSEATNVLKQKAKKIKKQAQ
eukprot:c790_g1_i1.p1 GENE.c790_g1_i1~~c790_g1_i1.p1  ORF type:complete len:656 (-),score=173.06 c790_g1_i1:67-2007(-)